MTEQVTEQTKTELEQLKEQADELGLTYPTKVTTKALKKLVAEALLKETDEDNSEEIQAVEDDNLKLVHVIVTPMDPSRRAKTHETFTVGNAVLGTISRVVPMGQPWLIENIIYKCIKEKEFQFMQEVKDNSSPLQTVVESRLVPAYSIQELPLPTQEEIAELAKQQSARDAV